MSWNPQRKASLKSLTVAPDLECNLMIPHKSILNMPAVQNYQSVIEMGTNTRSRKG